MQVACPIHAVVTIHIMFVCNIAAVACLNEVHTAFAVCLCITQVHNSARAACLQLCLVRLLHVCCVSLAMQGLYMSLCCILHDKC